MWLGSVACQSGAPMRAGVDPPVERAPELAGTRVAVEWLTTQRTRLRPQQEQSLVVDVLRLCDRGQLEPSGTAVRSRARAAARPAGGFQPELDHAGFDGALGRGRRGFEPELNLTGHRDRSTAGGLDIREVARPHGVGGERERTRRLAEVSRHA